ncbi:MAG: hypothetical protein M1838_001515 [Thelocarpon superellum]|nr:MAG: hypothetical protein M1838_001515 [Thelocarpon superellum]
MPWTRQPPPLQIFQDPGSYYEPPESYQLPPHIQPNPLRLVKNATSRRRSITFQPPDINTNGQSPRKTSQPTYHRPAYMSRHHDSMASMGEDKHGHGQDYSNMVSLPPPAMPTFITDSPVKKPSFSTFHTSGPHKPQKALFTTFPSARMMDKENVHPTTLYSDHFAEFPDAMYGQKGPMKRALIEAAPLRDHAAAAHPHPHKKGKVDEPAVVHVPEPEDMPPIEDDGLKPPYSYATLIGMSILRAPHRRLTLAQIYKWISDNFSYYRGIETGWQNSIRHNLSLNKAFVKQERPKDDPGKGNYWVIESGMEAQFIKDKQLRRAGGAAAAASISAPMATTAAPPIKQEATKVVSADKVMPVSVPAAAAAASQVVAAKAVGAKVVVPEHARVPEGLDDLSSDATLPASDMAGPSEDVTEEAPPFRLMNNVTRPGSRHAMAEQARRPSSAMVHSSPPHMDSSPPLLPVGDTATSPIPCFPLTTTETRAHKRQSESMDDSGYFSTLGSSSKRPRAVAAPTSDTESDSHKALLGRAEEAIARLRRSSNPSPTKIRGAAGSLAAAVQLASSSPTRPIDTATMLPPLTPATTFKVPEDPAPEHSPQTSLLLHRNDVQKLVDSPARRLNLDTYLPLTEDEENKCFNELFSYFSDPVTFADIDRFFPSPDRSPGKRLPSAPRSGEEPSFSMH